MSVQKTIFKSKFSIIYESILKVLISLPFVMSPCLTPLDSKLQYHELLHLAICGPGNLIIFLQLSYCIYNSYIYKLCNHAIAYVEVELSF